MHRERRLLSIIVLTILVYGFSIYQDYGMIVFPFPIFDFMLLIASFQFAWWNRKDIITLRKWYFIPYFSALFFKLLTNQLLWSVLLNDQSLEALQKSAVLDWIQLSYHIVLILSFFAWTQLEKIPHRYWFMAIFLMLEALGLFPDTYYFGLISIVCGATYILYYKSKNSLSYLLLLHGILDVLNLLMLMQMR